MDGPDVEGPRPGAAIRLEPDGRIIDGPIVQRHEMGQVTIVSAGRRYTGFPISPELVRDPETADQP